MKKKDIKRSRRPKLLFQLNRPLLRHHPYRTGFLLLLKITPTLSQKLSLGPYEGPIGWVKAVCKAQGINENHFPKNFTSGWEDGIALCALVSYYRPDLIDQKTLKSLDHSKGSDNIKLGINAAANAGCNDIMDAGDFGLERLSMQTYLSCVYKKFVEKM